MLEFVFFASCLIVAAGGLLGAALILMAILAHLGLIQLPD